MTIRLLPPNLVNQIAAGEVLERPASAVKELVENAIDAGATKIEVSLRDGGKALISVTDNGCGMGPQELSLAVERHATSKLPEEDLWNIHSLGFRGEALPSIGSVARMTLTSQRLDSPEAWSLSVEGGVKGNPEPAAFRPGTKIDIRDLFFATPARLKFLKTPGTEVQYALDTLNRLAMVYPDIAFSLSHDGKVLMSYGANDRLGRLKDIMGKDFALNALPLDAQREGITLTGYVGLPTLNRGTASHIYLVVNGRPVRDKALITAARVAYQDVLARDRYPQVALFLECPNDSVDVNVHPQKSEVRFRDSAGVRGLVIGAIKSVLAGAGHRTATTVSQAALGAFRPSPMSFVPTHQPSLRPFPQGAYEPTVSSLREEWRDLPLDAPSPRALAPQPDSPPTHYPLGVACAQVHGTYIVAQNDKGIVLVDQHAAHERLVYEGLKNQLMTRGIQTQPLLIPEVVELPLSQMAAIKDRLGELAEFGLVLEPFGEGAVLVREVPTHLQDRNYKSLVTDIADELSEFDHTTSLKEKIHEVCSTMACHGSIRAGKSLSLPEMNALLRQMETTPHAGQCNHGRPTYVELTLGEVEKLFGRR